MRTKIDEIFELDPQALDPSQRTLCCLDSSGWVELICDGEKVLLTPREAAALRLALSSPARARAMMRFEKH